jgi:hypothetical protein
VWPVDGQEHAWFEVSGGKIELTPQGYDLVRAAKEARR